MCLLCKQSFWNNIGSSVDGKYWPTPNDHHMDTLVTLHCFFTAVKT